MPRQQASTFRFVLIRVLPPALLVMVAIAITALFLVRNTLELEARSNLAIHARQMARLLEQRLDNIHGTMVSMAANEIMVQSLIDEASRGQFLTTYFASLRFPNVTPALVALTDYKGRLIDATSSQAEFVEQPWLSIVMQGQSFFSVDESHMTVAVPVYSYDLPEGVLVAVYTRQEMIKVLALPSSLALTQVLSAGGQMLYSSVGTASQDAAGTSGPNRREWILESQTLEGPVRLSLIVGDSAKRVFATIDQLALALAVIFLVALVILLFGMVYTASMVTRPLRHFTEHIRDIEDTDDGVRIRPEGPREFRYMAEAFNAMLERLDVSAQQRAEAEDASRAKSEFLSAMSHELRTPLNAILGFGQLLEYESSPPLDPAHRAHVSQILTAGRHLTALIDEVLDLSRIESGSMEISPENIELPGLLNEVVSLARDMAQKYAVAIEIESAEATLPVVFADRTRLKQVLLNLVSNGIKYNKEEGRVTIGASVLEDGFIRISVRDDGPGIEQEKLPQLFMPFNRLGRELGNIEGTGIGLSITDRLVQLMHGRIGVKSVVGSGSHFWVDLPSGKIGAAMRQSEVYGHRVINAGGDAVTRTVLYVEDNKANLVLVERILARIPNVELISAQTGELGFEIATLRKPDLIFLDINLPGMDGYEVLQRLHEHPATQHIPVYAISAAAMASEVERGRQAGFVDYITKPLDVRRVTEIVMGVAES